MEELYNLGISDNTIKSMLELNPDLREITSNEVEEKENILKKLGCSINQIINIIGSNSLFLTRTNIDVIKLIDCLSNYGFDKLNILFDSNPYILNFDSFEIDNYIQSRKSNGEVLEDIVDEMDSNPYLFNEI